MEPSTKRRKGKALEFIAKVQGVKDSGAVEKFFDFSLVRKVIDQLHGEGWNHDQLTAEW